MQNVGQFCTTSDTQFLDDLPIKIWEGEKNVLNPARFLTTFDFDREYLRNGYTNRKSK